MLSIALCCGNNLKNSGCKISSKLGLIRIKTHWEVENALLLVTFTDFRAVFHMKINTSWIPVISVYLLLLIQFRYPLYKKNI